MEIYSAFDAWRNSVTITIAPVDRRGRFSVRLRGRPLISSTRSPFCDGARELIRLGYDPDLSLLMRHEASLQAEHALRAPLGLAADLVVEEGAHGPIFRRVRKARRSAVAAPPIRRIAAPLPGVPGQP